MPKLINVSTGQPEDVSHDVLQDSLKSGKFNLVPGESYNLMSPDGKPVNVPAEDVYKATSQDGFLFPSQQAVDGFHKEQGLEEKYGAGAGNTMKALALGAARGGSFGLSDLALTQSGAMSPEEIQQLKDRHGTASTVGALGGVAAGLLTGTEELGALNAPGSLAKAGTAIAENPVVSGALGKYGATALGSAVEGAAYGAGNVISEAALGDPRLNSEKALSEIGYSALLGGAVGGAFSTAADALPAAFTKAKELVNAGGTDAGQQFLAKASSLASGKPVGAILDAMKSFGDIVPPEVAEKLSGDLASGLQEQYSAVNKAARETYSNVRPVETRALIDNTMLPGAQAESNRIFSAVDDTIKTIKESPELYPQRYATKLRQFQDTLVKADQGDAASLFESINDFKKLLDPELKFGRNISPELRDTASLLGDLRSELKNSLEDEGVWGEAGARQSSVNEAFNEFQTSQTQIQKDLMKKRLNKGGRFEFTVDPKKVERAMGDAEKMQALTEYHEASKKLLNEIEKSHEVMPAQAFDKKAVEDILGKNVQVQDVLSQHEAALQQLKGVMPDGPDSMLGNALIFGAARSAGPLGELAAAGYSMVKNPAVMIQRLASMERMFNKVTAGIDAGAKAIFNGSVKGAVASSGAVLSSQAFKKTTEQIMTAVNDPARLSNKLEQATRGAYSAAPNTVGALHESTARALTFLASKIPGQAQDSPLDEQPAVSAAERADFSNYLNIVHNPQLALKQLKHGTILPSTVETLQAVYPGLYANMQKAVVAQIANHKAKGSRPIPSHVQMGVSLFLGHNMTSSLAPVSMQRMQQAMRSGAAAANTQGNGMGSAKSSLGGLKQLGVAGRSATHMQLTSMRK